MKRFLFLTAAAALSASFAWGALGDVVASFPSPALRPIALAVPANYRSYLWVFCNIYPYRVYRLSGDTGSVYSSFVSPFGSNTRGLTYSWNGGGGLPAGSFLWLGYTGRPAYVYRCNYDTGSIYGSFPTRTKKVDGLAVKATGDGGITPTCMLLSCADLDNVYHKDLLTGATQSVFTASEDVFDLAWDWRNEIVWTGYWDDVVYGFNTTGSLVASFTLPDPAYYPVGFAYTSSYLWVSTLYGGDPVGPQIWKVHCPAFLDNTNVVPTSMGRIKAVFR